MALPNARKLLLGAPIDKRSRVPLSALVTILEETKDHPDYHPRRPLNEEIVHNLAVSMSGGWDGDRPIEIVRLTSTSSDVLHHVVAKGRHRVEAARRSGNIDSVIVMVSNGGYDDILRIYGRGLPLPEEERPQSKSYNEDVILFILDLAMHLRPSDWPHPPARPTKVELQEFLGKSGASGLLRNRFYQYAPLFKRGGREDFKTSVFSIGGPIQAALVGGPETAKLVRRMCHDAAKNRAAVRDHTRKNTASNYGCVPRPLSAKSCPRLPAPSVPRAGRLPQKITAQHA